MSAEDRLALQREIAATLGVTDTFDAAAEIERRVVFLADYLTRMGLSSYVLGISGGVDSLTAGCLAQRAVERIRQQGGQARFIAMRLPYGTQADEHEAQASLAVIKPDQVVTVNIKPAADAMIAAVKTGDIAFRDAAHEDFTLGNIKARQRMIAQYAVAAAHHGLVIGTDHAAEALMGFYTKFGDGAADLLPLSGLNKRRVRACAKDLGAPDELVYKVPTADLETLAPQKPDEAAFGITYEEIDDFLEGKPVSDTSAEVILRTYRNTAHKRALPVEPPPAS
ncbi:ammonia-dependent NAD(+) synthetase [Verticiella sediminum]|uniref:NH(3)-dependent NAD(+) synthetase n=1 Tax=Verticiella sediminum TaxID=1247510 RepID=A0A556AFD5_9BURK|nr:ammonia-dependent NAD(+) synthetase [Verticiella sediminum]TSH91606.1 ammonia-dependent NAD(+) synthetase [Verticiella sediminum]